MKITVFNGSPRAARSNTHIMVEAFLNGAKEAGAETANIFLAQKKINPCLGCFTCWIKTPGQCVHNDDMKGLLPQITNSDIVIFATPLYVDNVTGLMKNFMDRLVPTMDPHFEKDGNGECRHINKSVKTPKIAVISNCGFPEQSHFQVLRLLFKRIARNMGSEVIAEIYRGGGALLEADSILVKPLIWKYKKLLRKAGQELATNLKLSQETMAQLEKPLISDDQYIKNANKYFDKIMGQKK